MLTSNDICQKAKEIAAKKTAYVKLCPGLTLTQPTKLRYCGIDPFNSRNTKKIFALPDDTIGYDEFTFFSAVTGKSVKNLKEIIANCVDISKDFSDIKPGEIVFGGDRFGIFVGGHDVIAVNHLGVGMIIVEGWASHGKLMDISYDADGNTCPVETVKETENAEREVDRDVSTEEVIVEEPAADEIVEPKSPAMDVRPSSFRRRH